jgi:TPR repeat protein
MADILRQSKVLRAAAAPAPVAPAPQADPCDPQFLLARQVDQCRVWEGYLASCASHAKAPEARRLRDMACKVDACDAAFDRVAAADSCADWSGFIESCPGHSGMIAARFGVQLRCEAKPDAPSAPEPVAEPQPGIATAPAPAPAPAPASVAAAAAAAAPESRTSLAEVQRAARAALRARDYSEALRNYRQAADKGDATAQYMVGNFHFRGWGVVRDDTEALRWYRAAAAQGHKGAQLAVDRHATAQTTTAPATGAVTVSIPTVDHRKAPVAALATGSNAQVEAWYRAGKEHYARKAFVAALAEYEKAAAAGLAAAALDLGYMYQNGIGTERDIVQAVNYFHKAAERGNATGLRAMERVIAELTAKNPMQDAFWAVKYLELGGYAYAQKITDREVILRMQRILKGRGLYDGPLDGISGPRTLAAMRRLSPG